MAGVDALRSVESARLEVLQFALWPDAMAGDVSAVQAVLKIAMQRCRLLGLVDPRPVPRSPSNRGVSWCHLSVEPRCRLWVA